ncbi:pimeloyl-ACP methyl ester carboxylesterase [Arthrobacter sp. CAN_A6]|uniref:alpha/beta fold hydrolase n=1 Tax=Arthrobacter sp. CAN_A6 TaxID=2787721 RepID=UPI0018CB75BF
MDVLRERRRTVSAKGAELAVFEYGPEPDPSVPSLLLVHGYPDDHRVFQDVLRELAPTHHLVAYDTRNAGQSVASGGTGTYRLAALVDDLFAVLDALDSASVHLAGHDWGSIQGWAAIQDPRAAGRITGFTSISGPDLRHFSRWLRAAARTPRRWPQLAGQLMRSWYVAAFQIPLLPESAWRLFLTRRYEFAVRRSVDDNPERGLALYRTNLFSKEPLPPFARVSMPVQVVVPLKDPFLSPALVDGLDTWVDDLTVLRVKGGHWWPATRPADFAEVLRTGLLPPQ